MLKSVSAAVSIYDKLTTDSIKSFYKNYATLSLFIPVRLIALSKFSPLILLSDNAFYIVANSYGSNWSGFSSDFFNNYSALTYTGGPFPSPFVLYFVSSSFMLGSFFTFPYSYNNLDISTLNRSTSSGSCFFTYASIGFSNFKVLINNASLFLSAFAFSFYETFTNVLSANSTSLPSLISYFLDKRESSLFDYYYTYIFIKQKKIL